MARVATPMQHAVSVAVVCVGFIWQGHCGELRGGATATSVDTNRVYSIDKFVLAYGPPDTTRHPDLPALDDLLTVSVQLGLRDNTYVRRASEETPSKLILGD